MEGKDLRIGNYVEYLIFDEIDTPNQWWSSSIIDANDIVCIDANADENYRPIKLTEQHLIDFGYKKENNHFLIQVHKICKCNEIFVCDKNGVTLEYVHGLQNLFFAINKKELTYKS